MSRGWLGRLLGAGLALAALMSGSQASAADGPRLYYHVFVRSFADSNGDRIGDLPGVAAHLDYLAKLHVTHILLTPMQASPFYHNYFATDFDAVDGRSRSDLFSGVLIIRTHVVQENDLSCQQDKHRHWEIRSKVSQVGLS